MNFENYSFRRKEGLTWEIRNNVTGHSVTFVEGRYSKTACPVGNGSSYKEFSDVIEDKDINFIASCNIQARLSLIAKLDTELLAELAYKLKGVVSPCDADEYAFPECLAEMTSPMTSTLKTFSEIVTNDELIEMYRMIDAYYLAPYNFDEWANDVRQWIIDANKQYIRPVIGQKIREIRIHKGMTQTQLAERACCTQANINRIEAGMFSVGVDVLNRIAIVLGMRIELK